jgi:hypothetical protein
MFYQNSKVIPRYDLDYDEDYDGNIRCLGLQPSADGKYIEAVYYERLEKEYLRILYTLARVQQT